MNDILCATYTGEEVKTALFQMFSTKSPGPEGFPAHFYQQHWDVYGEEVTKAVLRIVRGEESPECINDTSFGFDPKGNESNSPDSIQTNKFMQCVIQDSFEGSFK